ncbi:tetratricopeptide repeat protein [Legionella sp. 29fVS95]|uniref:tetratricopeptide repeat protein n=1 Tax=Legionella sp. 29fVS95 TaxID=3402813 RepID=UPI003AF8AEB7
MKKMNNHILYATLGVLCSFSITYADDAQRTKNILRAADAMVLQLKHKNKEITDSQYLELLEKCNDSGNKFCSAFIGVFYCNNHDYRKAYPYFLKSINVPLSQYNLGQMYQNGSGVLQSLDKSIYYFKMCARGGDKDCAMGVSKSYAQKSEFKEAFAWMMIYSALGGEIGMDGKKLTLLDFTESCRKFMSKSEIQQANIIAQEICKTIPACNL